MTRIIIGWLCAALVLSAVVAPPATAATQRISAGDGYSMVGDPFTCTIAAAGHWHGRPAALTAGHCGAVGRNVALKRTPRTVFGTFVHVSANPDYGVIALRSESQVGTNYATRIASPRQWQAACKTGHGIFTPGTWCGHVINITPTSFASTIPFSWFDSGSPVYHRGALIGIVSQLLDPAIGPWVATRADQTGFKIG